MSAFAYDSLDRKTRELALELEALGGGDASLGGFEVHAVIDDRVENEGGALSRKDASEGYKQDARTLWIHGKTIGIRDTTKPRSRPSAEVMTYADVSSSMRLQVALQDRNALVHKSSTVVDWVLRGYNACLIGYGQREIGKTLFFFGTHTKERPTVEYTQPSMCSAILRQLYDKAGLPRKAPAPHLRALEQTSYGEASDKSKSPERRRPEGVVGFNSGAPAPQVTIAVSCWCVKGNHVLDLCLDSKAESEMQRKDGVSALSGVLDFATIDCNTYEDALMVIHTARGRAMAKGSVALGADARTKLPEIEKERSHFFCRIIVHRPAPHGLGGRVTVPEGETLLSHLHLVDLIGKQESEHDLLHANPKLDSVQLQNAKIARKENNLQLSAFTGTLHQMKSHVQGREKGHERKGAIVTQARDSRLSSVLSPLIQGNCKTLLFAFLKEGQEHYRSSLTVMEMVNGLTSLSCPCHRVSGVPRGALGLRSTLSVLPPPDRPDDDIFYSATYELAGGVGHRGGNPLSTDPIPSDSNDGGGSASRTVKGSPRSGRAFSLDDSVAEYGEVNLLGLAATDSSPRSMSKGQGPGHSLKSPSEGSDEMLGNGGATGPAAPLDNYSQGYTYAPSSALPSMTRTDTTVNQFHELLHAHSMASSIADTSRERDAEGGSSFAYDQSGDRKKREEQLLAQIEISQEEHDQYLRYMHNTNKSSAEAAEAGASVGSIGGSTRPFMPSPGRDKSTGVPEPSIQPSAQETESFLRFLGNPRSQLHEEPAKPSGSVLGSGNSTGGDSSTLALSSDDQRTPPSKGAAGKREGKQESPELAPHEISKISPRKVDYSPHRGDAFRDQLRAIYRLYAPEKLDNVDMIAERFAGREILLLEELHKKYDIEDHHLELFEAHTEGTDLHKHSVQSGGRKDKGKDGEQGRTPDDTRTLRQVKSSLEEYRQKHPDSHSTDASENSDSGDKDASGPLVVGRKLNALPSTEKGGKYKSTRKEVSGLSPMKLSSFGLKALSLSAMMGGDKSKDREKGGDKRKKVYVSSGSGSDTPSSGPGAFAASAAGGSPSLLDLADPDTVILSPHKEASEGGSLPLSPVSSSSDSDGAAKRNEGLEMADLSAPKRDSNNNNTAGNSPSAASSPAKDRSREKGLTIPSPPSSGSGGEGFSQAPHSPSKGDLSGRLASGISSFTAFRTGGNKQKQAGSSNARSRSRSKSPGRFASSGGIDISASESVALLLEQDGMSEVDLLRRNTATLMEAINTERRERLRVEDELAESQEKAQEELARKDLEIEDRKLEVVRLTAQMRALSSKEPDLEDVYAVFEAHVTRYQKEAEQLRTDLAKTQIELMEALESSPVLPLPVPATSAGEGEQKSENSALYGKYERLGMPSASASMNATDVHTSVFEAAINGSRDAAAAVTGSVFAAATRAKAAKQTYRKLQHEHEQLWNDLETLRGKERKYEVGQRIAAEGSRRVKESLHQISTLKAALQAEREATRAAQANYDAVTTDFRDMRASEKSLREERSRMIDELSLLRSRVRQVDDERQRLLQVNAFSLPSSAQPSPDLLPVEGGGGDDGKLAGNFDKSQYNRREENDVGNASLETALADLHEALVQNEPTLLPLLRKIGNEIHFERTRHLEQRAELLRHVYPTASTTGRVSPGVRSGHRRGYSTTQASYSQSRGPTPTLKKSSSLSPPRKQPQYSQQQPTRGSSVSISANSAFDAMARFQAAKARRAAADQIKSERSKQQQKSQRVKWETVGF